MLNQEHSIEVTNLTKYYGPVMAIHEVSFNVEKGEIVGFLGPNGAGKSTTMRILCGLITAKSGSAKICGISIASNPAEIKRRIGYMAENNPLPEDMRVVEYLYYRGRLKEIPRKQLKDRVEETLELCDLNRTARRKVIATLSKGYRQRVGIADAILSEPEVIIMDEPTIGLDPHQVLMIRDLIKNLRGKMTVIISSHILSEVELCCDRVIIINQGHIVACGTSESLRNEFINTTTYTLNMKGNTSALDSLLREIDPDLEISSSLSVVNDDYYDLELTTPHTRNLSEEILTRLYEHPQFRLRELRRKVPNLEDIFLAATRRRWDEDIPLSNNKVDRGKKNNQETATVE